MKNFAELLFDLQALEMGPNETKNENAGKISSLREKIPAPVLAHYDRLANRGKKGIALVRNGVCGECHMRLASGIYAQVLRGDDVVICDSCGRYLYALPVPTESVSSKSIGR